MAHLMVNVEVHLMVNTIPLNSLTAVADKAEELIKNLDFFSSENYKDKILPFH